MLNLKTKKVGWMVPYRATWHACRVNFSGFWHQTRLFLSTPRRKYINGFSLWFNGKYSIGITIERIRLCTRSWWYKLYISRCYGCVLCSNTLYWACWSGFTFWEFTASLFIPAQVMGFITLAIYISLALLRYIQSQKPILLSKNIMLKNTVIAWLFYTYRQY